MTTTAVDIENPGISSRKAGQYVYIAAIVLLCAWVIVPLYFLLINTLRRTLFRRKQNPAPADHLTNLLVDLIWGHYTTQHFGRFIFVVVECKTLHQVVLRLSHLGNACALHVLEEVAHLSVYAPSHGPRLKSRCANRIAAFGQYYTHPSEQLRSRD